jgi:hypothetical protein
MLPNLSAEDETENTACCVKPQVTNVKIRKRNNTKDIVAVAHSLQWKWGDHLLRMV